jgi:hypothetical protein
MADTTDILMSMIEENWNQVRHSEDQRATITNLLIIVASVIHGVLTQTGFTKSVLPLTLLLIILGLYGIVVSAKLYERTQMLVNRARKFRHRLDELLPDAHLESLKKAADEEHFKRFPVISQKIRLSRLWLVLHVIIALLGFIYSLIILIHW